MAAITLDLPPVVISSIFSKAREQSAVAQLARKESLLSPKDHIIYSFDGDDAKFHTPGGADKAEGADTVTDIDVPVRTLYKIMKFHDVDYDDAVGRRIIDQVVEKLPGFIAETYDKAVFGPTVVPTSPFGGFTGTPLEVDETPESWMAAYDAVTASGYTPTGWVLDKSMIAAVRRASTDGSITNPLSLAVGDGFPIAGAPAYFRKLGGNRGVVGDWNQAVVATYSGLTIELHSPQNDFSLRKENAYAVYAGVRVGFGVADQDAFQRVTLDVTP